MHLPISLKNIVLFFIILSLLLISGCSEREMETVYSNSQIPADSQAVFTFELTDPVDHQVHLKVRHQLGSGLSTFLDNPAIDVELISPSGKKYTKHEALDAEKAREHSTRTEYLYVYGIAQEPGTYTLTVKKTGGSRIEFTEIEIDVVKPVAEK